MIKVNIQKKCYGVSEIVKDKQILEERNKESEGGKKRGENEVKKNEEREREKEGKREREKAGKKERLKVHLI